HAAPPPADDPSPVPLRSRDPVRTRAFVRAGILLAALLALAPPTAAQERDEGSAGAQAAAAPAEPTSDSARLSTRAARIPDGVEFDIDGRLEEEGWGLATPITEFRQQEPVEGGEPTESTEIRILFDAEALYIGAMLYDSNPDGILAYQLERD